MSQKDQIAALYFTMSDIVPDNRIFFLWKIKMAAQSDLSILKFECFFYDLIKNHPLFAFMVEWSLNRNHLANSLNSQVWHLTFCQGEDFGFIWTLQYCCPMCSVQFKFFISDFLLHHLIFYHFYEGRQDLKLIWKT